MTLTDPKTGKTTRTIRVTYPDGEVEEAAGDHCLINLIVDWATTNGYKCEEVEA